MKKLNLFSLVFGILFLLSISSFVNAQSSENMTVKVNVLDTEVSISVPDEVVFEDIAQGYLSESQSIDIVNEGTVDVEVSADLDEDYNGTIFQNLAFKRIQADDLTNIRYFSFEIEKPSVVGGERIEDIYIFLDLVDYEEKIVNPLFDHTATVIFTAVPA